MSFSNALNNKKRPVIAGILVTLILLFIFSLILYERNFLYKDANWVILILFYLMLSFLGGYFVWYTTSQSSRLKNLVNERISLLEASEEKYHKIFERTSDAVFITDYSGNFIDVNKGMCLLLGVHKQELLKMNIQDLMDVEELKKNPLHFDKLSGDKNLIAEKQIRKITGGFVYLEINFQKLDSERIMGIGRDVTELQKAHQQIELNEKILKNAFDYSALGMAFISLEGNYLKVNKELCNIVGYSESELLTMKLFDVTYSDDTLKDLEFIDRALKKEIDTYRREKRYYHKNGSIVWANVNVSVVKDENDKPSFFVTQVENITEKRIVTELLKEREEQLRIFIEHCPAALAMFDTNMNYIMISNRYRTDYNLGPIEIIGKNYYDIFPTTPGRWKKIHEECLAGAVRESEEDSFEREDGTMQWLKWEIRPWRKNSGEIGGIILFSKMVTELKESQLKFQNLVEKSPVGVYIIHNEKTLYVNPRFAEIFGYTAEEITMPESAMFLFHKDDMQIVNENIRKRMDGLTDYKHYQVRGIKKTAEVIWLDIHGTTTQYKGMKAIIGTMIDITKSKESEALILHEKNLSDTIINGLPGIFYVCDTEGNLLRWNKNMERITGYSTSEIAGRKTSDFVTPQQLDSIISMRQNIFETGKASAEVEIITKQKQRLVYYITIMPVLYNGEQCILGMGIDFTEKKNVEFSLVKKNREINERVKELSCLFKLSELVNRDISVEQILKEAVEMIPPAHQFPESTGAQIVFGEKVFSTPNFIETQWQHEALIGISNNPVGKVTVCYTHEPPPDENVFLEEEVSLINSIAGILGGSIERKLATEEILKLGRLYRFTAAINEMMLRADNKESLFSEACHIAIDQGKFRMAWIGDYDPTSEKVVPVSCAGYEKGYLNKIKISTSEDSLGRGPTGSAIRHRQCYYCNDIANDPTMLPWKYEALNRGYRSSICLPIVVNTKLIGAFSLYMNEPFFFNENEIKLLKEVTDNIAYAYEKIELRNQQQKAEEKLKESEEKFRKLVEETLVGVFILQDGLFKYVNPQIEQMSGYSKDELMDAPFTMIIHSDDVEEMLQKYFARISGQSLENHYFTRGVKKDGSVRYIEIIASVINYRTNPAIIGTAIDITEQTEEENRITRAVTDAQENERQQISMELHDNVKQIMAASLMNLEFVGMKMTGDETLVHVIGNVKNYIRDAVEELRKLSHKLAPSIDLNVPLEEKIKALVDAMNISEKLQVSYSFEKFDKPIAKDAQLAIYRILQEQFSNILKYAKASEVKINLERKKGNIIMSVSDNGVGFDTTIRKFGIGLENIKRRMQMFKGKMEILSEPGKGCTLTVLIPDE